MSACLLWRRDYRRDPASSYQPLPAPLQDDAVDDRRVLLQRDRDMNQLALTIASVVVPAVVMLVWSASA